MPNDGSKSFQLNLHFKESCDGEIDKQKQFIQIVNSFVGAEIDSLEHKANNLLHIISNFFIDNYDHPIYESGIQLIDMVYLQRPL